MPVSETKRKNNDVYDAKTYKRIGIKARIDSRMSERIDMAVSQGKGQSKNQYMIDAVEAALTRDGFGIDTVEKGKDG